MTHVEHLPGSNVQIIGRRLDAAAWGLFFLWIGLGLIANLGWGLGLLGVGAITLGEQIARKSFGLAAEGFWIGVGVLFVLGGVWELLGVQFSLVPIVLIVAGAALLLNAVRGKSA